MSNALSRRGFLLTTAAGAAGLRLAGSLEADEPKPGPSNPAEPPALRRTDTLVVGAGPPG